MTVYIDITQLEKQRVNTGIQRVVKEFLQRAITSKQDISYKVLLYNTKIQKMQLLQNKDVALFLKDIKNFQFLNKQVINIESIKPEQTSIFFDIDSAWNAPYKREELYPILKNNGFYIANFIHDLIPILLPQYVQKVVIDNYKPFIEAVYKYSDTVLFNSTSSKNDFLDYKAVLKIKRDISTKVVGLGSDFKTQQTNPSTLSPTLNAILNKKYILFVGTIEPRKNHEDVFDAFNILSKKYPDLNLVFIGIKGWKNDTFMQKIASHPLKEKRLFWLNNIDDDTLYHFYKNAFVVTYLSKYEGYGLPIVESLQHGNITITSNNSSMPEVGLDFADYIDNFSINQLVQMVSLYIEDQEHYNQKKQHIKQNFKTLSWDEHATLIFNTLNIKKRTSLQTTLKNKIKSIPLIGIAARWLNNLARLNNLKHRLYISEQKIAKLQKQNTALSKPSDTTTMDDYYVAFEDKFRGSRPSILKRYIPYLKYIDPVLQNIENKNIKALDIGCGRGEWLQLLQEKNIDAQGLDLNNSILNIAKQNGVKNLQKSDAISFLKKVKDNTYDIVTAFHIIEHIPYEKLFELLQEIKRVSKKDAIILLETPNPLNIEVGAYSFYMDPTHLNPLPAPNIKFMAEYIGFKNVTIDYINPSTSPKEAKDYLIISTK